MQLIGFQYDNEPAKLLPNPPSQPPVLHFSLGSPQICQAGRWFAISNSHKIRQKYVNNMKVISLGGIAIRR